MFLYGNYRNKKFTDIYPDVSTFLSDYNNVGIETTIKTASATTLYYLLYAHYGNSTIANADENQFKYKIFATIYMYGPAWEKRLAVQKAVRDLNDTDLVTGSKAIYNHAFNPEVAPTTGTLEELTYINDQNVTNYKRSKLDAYAILMDLIKTDVTEAFIGRFKKLFLQVVAPELPLWYEEDNE